MKYSNYPTVEAYCRKNADEIDERVLSFVEAFCREFCRENAGKNSERFLDAIMGLFNEYGFDKGFDIALTLLAMAR